MRQEAPIMATLLCFRANYSQWCITLVNLVVDIEMEGLPNIGYNFQFFQKSSIAQISRMIPLDLITTLYLLMSSILP